MTNDDDLPMGTTDAKTLPEPTPAPRVKQALAGLIDAGVLALPVAIYWRRAWRAGDMKRAAARQPGWMRMPAPAAGVLGEQVGTPGGWIMGVRTVDSEHRMSVTVSFWPPLLAALGSTLANRTVRRLLAPTLVVSRAKAEPPAPAHSP